MLQQHGFTHINQILHTQPKCTQSALQHGLGLCPPDAAIVAWNLLLHVMQTVQRQGLASTSQLLVAPPQSQARLTRLALQQQLLLLKLEMVLWEAALRSCMGSPALRSCSSSWRGCWRSRRSGRRASARQLHLQQQQQQACKVQHQHVVSHLSELPEAKAGRVGLQASHSLCLQCNMKTGQRCQTCQHCVML